MMEEDGKTAVRRTEDTSWAMTVSPPRHTIDDTVSIIC